MLRLKYKLALLAPVALAALIAPTQAHSVTVDMRIEGFTGTTFEAPLETTTHLVRSPSDTQDRRCDATNEGASAIPPMPTATGAIDDASIAGEFTWDGTWFPQFFDYFSMRIGPDATDDANLRYWGLLINGEYAQVGGCQAVIEEGDDVVWAYDAFSPTTFEGRQALELDGFPFGEPGDLVELEVTNALDGEPVEGATAGGEVTDADGLVEVTLGAGGLQSFKATKPDTIRSNRLDICVEDNLTGDDCQEHRVPVCENGSATVEEDKAVVLNLSCEGLDPQFSIAGTPSNGSVGAIDQAGAQVTYTPAANFSGKDEVRFKATNAAGTSLIARIKITVTEVPEAVNNPGPPTVTTPPAGQPAQQAAVPVPVKKPAACASLKGKKLKRCKALQKCKTIKRKSKRAKCKAKARKIGAKKKSA